MVSFKKKNSGYVAETGNGAEAEVAAVAQQDVPADDVLTGTAAYDAGVGEMPSWSELVEEHADSVYRLALRLSGNPHDAEDLTQETFMRVFRSLDKYQPGTFRGWLHRITTNLFMDMVRHRSKIRMVSLPEDYDVVPSQQPTPGEQYELSNMDPTVQRALDSLSPEFRVAVVLCDVVGLSYEEIADTLGVKMGTVRSRIHRGRSQLKAFLEREAAQNAEVATMVYSRG